MKLLFVLRKFSNGGVTKTLTQRLNYLSEFTDFELHVVTEFPNDEKLISKINQKVHIHVLNLEKILIKRRMPILGYFQIIKEVEKEFKKVINYIKPDVISGFNYGYNKEILPFLNISAIKVVELRGAYKSRNKLKRIDFKYSIINFFRKDYKVLQNKYDYGITISKQDALDRAYFKRDIRCIYNTYKYPKEISDFSERSNIIIAAGTLTHNKNFKDLIKASKLIEKNLENWEIHIYGEGEQREFLNNLIKKLDLTEIIKLKGPTHTLNEFYNNSKLLISTSLSEGFGNTILEALTYRVPVISYDCKCGPREILMNGKNGYLIEFDYKILAKKILKLIENESLLNSFSQNTVLSLDKFDYKEIMLEWNNFYEEILMKNQ